PHWNPLTTTTEAHTPQEVWDTGTRHDRLALLKQLRASDSSLAQKLVAESWEAETAAERAAMLEQFGTALGPNDESWLEKCLDDRSKQVREVAARLLSRLPDSAFSQSMAERARASVHFVAGG